MYIYIRSGYVCIYVNRYVHKHVYIYVNVNICIYIYIYPGAAERPGGHWFPVAKSESVSAQAKQDYVSLQSRICECSASVLWVSGMLKDCPKASNNSLEDQHAVSYFHCIHERDGDRNKSCQISQRGRLHGKDGARTI